MEYQRRLRDLREDHDKTQQEIADVLGTSQTMYARYERGANELPVRHLIKLAEYYHVSTDYLLGVTELKNHPNAELHELHLSDAMLELLKSGRINN